MDTEILGGCVMAFVVITPMILLAYAIEGSEIIQESPEFQLIGLATLIFV